jgi:hypothetical protein
MLHGLYMRGMMILRMMMGALVASVRITLHEVSSSGFYTKSACSYCSVAHRTLVLETSASPNIPVLLF